MKNSHSTLLALLLAILISITGYGLVQSIVSEFSSSGENSNTNTDITDAGYSGDGRTINYLGTSPSSSRQYIEANTASTTAYVRLGQGIDQVSMFIHSNATATSPVIAWVNQFSNDPSCDGNNAVNWFSEDIVSAATGMFTHSGAPTTTHHWTAGQGDYGRKVQTLTDLDVECMRTIFDSESGGTNLFVELRVQ